MYTLPQVNKRPTPSRRFVLPRSGPRACAKHGVSGVEKTCGQKIYKFSLECRAIVAHGDQEIGIINPGFCLVIQTESEESRDIFRRMV
jgi:hypothetical protein